MNLFILLFELYNFASIVLEDGKEVSSQRDEDKVKLEALRGYVQKNIKSAFTGKGPTTAKEGTEGKKRKRGEGDEDNGSQNVDVYDRFEVSEGLHDCGYVVEPNEKDEDEDEDDKGGRWIPLNRLHPNMRRATHPRGRAVILKLIRSDCNELSILQYLGSLKNGRNHAIPILDAFSFSVGTIIAMPEGQTLNLGITSGDFCGKIVDLMRQFVSGVGFLHEHRIAHLDLNPRNVIVCSSRLYIIDFDISVQVESMDATISRWCGTAGWMAPEIGERNGPRREYNPIRADLWSCGRVLGFLGDSCKNEVNIFSRWVPALLADDPSRRPMMVVLVNTLLIASPT